jgi:hypothetical protein
MVELSERVPAVHQGSIGFKTSRSQLSPLANGNTLTTCTYMVRKWYYISFHAHQHESLH